MFNNVAQYKVANKLYLLLTKDPHQKKKMHLTAFLGLSLILQRKIILQEDKIETLKTFF